MRRAKYTMSEVPRALRRFVSQHSGIDDSKTASLQVLADPDHRGTHRQLRVSLDVRTVENHGCADVLFVWRLPNDIYLQPAEVAVSTRITYSPPLPVDLGTSEPA